MEEAKIDLSDKVISEIVKKLKEVSLNRWKVEAPDCSPITSVELVFNPTPEMQLEIKIAHGGSRIEVEMREKEDDYWKIVGVGETYFLFSDPNYKFFAGVFRSVLESYEKNRKVKETRVNEKLFDALK